MTPHILKMKEGMKVFLFIVTGALLLSCGKPFISIDGDVTGMDSAEFESLQPPLDLMWRTKLKGPMLAPPAVRGSTMFVPMSNNKIYLMNAREGTVAEFSDDVNGTGAVTPVLYEDMLYLPVVGQTTREWREFVAFNIRSRKTVWRRPMLNAWSSPALADGVLFMGTDGGIVYAIDAESGETVWERKLDRQVRSSAVVRGGRVFVGSNDNHLYALDANSGGILWSFDVGGSVPVAPAVSGNTVFAASYDKSLYCIDAVTGTLNWRFVTGGSIYSRPVVHDGRVYIGSNDRHLYCIDAQTGEEAWRFETDGLVVASALPVGPVVYAVATDRHVYALDASTGSKLWEYETEGSISVPPMIVDGILIVGSEDRYVYAFSSESN